MNKTEQTVPSSDTSRFKNVTNKICLEQINSVQTKIVKSKNVTTKICHKRNFLQISFSDVSERVPLYSDAKLYKDCLQKQFWREIQNSQLHDISYKKLTEIQNSKYFIDELAKAMKPEQKAFNVMNVLTGMKTTMEKTKDERFVKKDTDKKDQQNR